MQVSYNSHYVNSFYLFLWFSFYHTLFKCCELWLKIEFIYKSRNWITCFSDYICLSSGCFICYQPTQIKGKSRGTLLRFFCFLWRDRGGLGRLSGRSRCGSGFRTTWPWWRFRLRRPGTGRLWAPRSWLCLGRTTSARLVRLGWGWSWGRFVGVNLFFRFWFWFGFLFGWFRLRLLVHDRLHFSMNDFMCC